METDTDAAPSADSAKGSLVGPPPVPTLVVTIVFVIAFLAIGAWWRLGGEHLTGGTTDLVAEIDVGEPIHIAVPIITEGGGEIEITEARVRNLFPTDIGLAEVGVVVSDDPFETLIGPDVAPYEFASVSGAEVDGAGRTLVVSFSSPTAESFLIDDVIVRYRDGFRQRGTVIDLCAEVVVGDPEVTDILSPEVLCSD